MEGKIDLSEIGRRFEMKGINIAKIVIKSSFTASQNQKSFIHLVLKYGLEQLTSQVTAIKHN